MFRNKVAKQPKLSKAKERKLSEPNVPTVFVLEKELAQDVQKVEQLQTADNAEFRFSDHSDDEQTQQATVAEQDSDSVIIVMMSRLSRLQSLNKVQTQ